VEVPFISWRTGGPTTTMVCGYLVVPSVEKKKGGKKTQPKKIAYQQGVPGDRRSHRAGSRLWGKERRGMEGEKKKFKAASVARKFPLA